VGKDANHQTIFRAFDRAGASVVSLHTLGGGVPDLLVGFAGVERLVEVKLPARHHSWGGHPPVVVRTPEEAEALVDEMAAEGRRLIS
jgi:hypothetical protein